MYHVVIFITAINLCFGLCQPSGDGRNDSPGFSAQYCTYTVMDYDTGDILNIAIVDKREVGLKSPNMEKAAFLRCLQALHDGNVKVKEVITDAHPSIRAYLSKYFILIRS